MILETERLFLRERADSPDSGRLFHSPERTRVIFTISGGQQIRTGMNVMPSPALTNIFVCLGNNSANKRSDVFTCATCNEVNYQNQYDLKISKTQDIEFRTAQDEEQHEQYRSPTVCALHHCFRFYTKVYKYCSCHHANKKVGQFERNYTGRIEM